MKKIITFVLSVIITVIVVFAIGKNLIVKAAIVSSVKAATGVPISIDHLNIDFFDTLIEVRSLKAYNPKGYAEPLMCDVPEIFLDLEAGDLLKRKIHVEQMNLYLKELIVVKNAEGQVNINALKPARKEKAEEPGKPAPAPKKSPFLLQIDSLHLKVDRVVYKDYSVPGTAPSEKIFHVRIDQNYENVNDLKTLVGLIVVKSLTKTSLDRLTHLDLADFQSTIKNYLTPAENLKASAQQAWESAKATIQDMF
ncbi:MAG: AsmA family protein [Candidatus Omnitrophica bacterium]|nr:AsmA family protein [Candidatus Omnitrophota bacterium]